MLSVVRNFCIYNTRIVLKLDILLVRVAVTVP